MLEKKEYHKEPEIYTIDGFITKEECKHIIKLARPKLTRAMVGAGNGGENDDGSYSKNRTGTNCWFKHDHDEIFLNVGKKIAKQVGHPLENAEQFQIVHYDVGEEFKSHVDGWEQDGSKEHFYNFKNGGNRLVTALVYLNDVEEGGGTKMMKLNYEIQAQQGKLLVFEDCFKGTNNINKLSEHCGMPVIKGEKFAFNLWFKECPFDINYEEFKPGYFSQWSDPNKTLTDEEEYELDNIPPSELDFYFNKIHDDKFILFKENVLQDFECLEDVNYIHYKDREIAFIKPDENHYNKIIKPLFSLLDLNSEKIEALQLVKFNKNTTPFYDAYKSNKIGIKKIEQLGQRIYTLTVCVAGNATISFQKLDLQAELNKGSCIFYKNIVDNDIYNRDDMLLHEIQTNNCELLNIYIIKRPDTNNQKTNNQQTNIQSVLQNNKHLDEYKKIMQNLATNIEPFEGTHFNYLEKAITLDESQDFIHELVRLKASMNIFNKEQLKKIIVRNDNFIINDLLSNECLELLINYTKRLEFRNHEARKYSFVINDLFSRILQFEFLQVAMSITKINLEPDFAKIFKFKKNYKEEVHGESIKYSLFIALDNYKLKMFNDNYNNYSNSNYLPVNEEYEIIEFNKNKAILVPHEKKIIQRISNHNNFIELKFDYI